MLEQAWTSMSTFGHMQYPCLQKASPGSADMLLQSDVFAHGISVSAIESAVSESAVYRKRTF